MSLPSRGAWIEINVRGVRHQKRQVAPLAGSVDRNLMSGEYGDQTGVAPLAGSVDRNIPEGDVYRLAASRSPRGERG